MLEMRISQLEKFQAGESLGVVPEKNFALWVIAGIRSGVIVVSDRSSIERLKRFAAETLKDLLSGSPRVPSEVKSARMDICRSCPSGLFVEESSGCKSCGCDMSIKSGWSGSVCPLGYWGEHSPESEGGE